ncbi:hypothetical protein BDF20DRAFT_847880 [Mycotypha africana]|uniref:uncharacterized protein n=1 Tax=Mycotypha africana TaxID=64632 RepID=UPI0022FFD3C6|nr:uncharacterized protein BDF20DRAFT_847880 [Mycotypha africana]KAI8992036.1 hypothetical protein BDF20DRAFT_847880 [Mycotypha africana]
MPLIAIYYHNTTPNNTPVFSPTTTTAVSVSSSSTNSSKWKKGLAVLSTKYQESKMKYLHHHKLYHHHLDDQLLVAAAATEKVLCHVNTNDSNYQHHIDHAPTTHSVHFDNSSTSYYTIKSFSNIQQFHHQAITTTTATTASTTTTTTTTTTTVNTSNASADVTTVSPSSSNDVQCGNLTAKEFAQMAGIKIKSAHDFELEQQQQQYTTTSSVLPTTTMMTTMTTYSTRTAFSTKSIQQQPHIWDSVFWQSDKEGSSLPTKEAQTLKEDNIKNQRNQQLSQQQEPSDPIQPYNTPILSRTRKKQNVIHKGRFEIVVGDEDVKQEKNINGASVQEPQNLGSQKKPTVVEWKRKRSDSCAVPNNIPRKRT